MAVMHLETNFKGQEIILSNQKLTFIKDHSDLMGSFTIFQVPAVYGGQGSFSLFSVIPGRNG